MDWGTAPADPQDPDTYDPTSLEVGEFVTVEVYRGNVFRICDLYRVS